MKKIALVFMAITLATFIQIGHTAAQEGFRLDPREATSWRDKGIVYGAGNEKAYYPSVLFDADAFGIGSGPGYKMWYSDGDGFVYVVTSWDGRSWSNPTVKTDLGSAHHVQVVYDPNCFGATPCDSSDAKYKIWYWDIDAELYSICAMATAKSIDGIYWTDDMTLTQSGTSPLVTGDCSTTGGGTGWNRGSYGPVHVIYQPEALNAGDGPWGNRYVMFFNGTNFDGIEETGLAYSDDAKDWTGYAGNPVLRRTPLEDAWDSDDAVYGTVLKDGGGFHFWYSGGGSVGAHDGIGYAFSLDGLTWAKVSDPIFHISDEGADHRSNRTYTPSVIVNQKGRLMMYYSAKSSDNDYAIGLAVQKSRKH